MKYKDEMVDAIVKEIHQRHEEFSMLRLESIYFGGGTPSLLSLNDLDKIFGAINKYTEFDQHTEITLEANPDDLTRDKLIELKSTSINRLSVGIQSFDDADLKYMNRAHNSGEAKSCIRDAQDVGFEAITADLIYGSPTTNNETWISNIESLLSFDISHISAYCLTVEEGTALHHFVKNGKSKPVDAERSIEQFETLIEMLTAAGYLHYEISNFGKMGSIAVHNTNYWRAKPYVGIGPAAHSFNGHDKRRWNVSNNAQYIKAINSTESQLYWQEETLNLKDRYNELVLTGLRTMWGLDKKLLSGEFFEFWKKQSIVVGHLIDDKLLVENETSFQLSLIGKLFADRISMQLFMD